ncbi:substrate-binding domain-containing protein [Proteocatella sphenisci]|uniref:substrate-binding domain-containing protein n=1 Tax=Proteocatella sphenisci TaxID=181070 RepID=UPI0004BBAE55|nr:substrate-binding domain-containing protein [Proteocatella sphenisci]
MKKSKKTLSLMLTLLMSFACINFAFADSAYTVKSGDTLGKIAARYGVTYQEIAKVNKIANVNKILVGQKLLIPSKNTALAVQKPVEAKTQVTGVKGTKLRIATTTSTNDTGLLDVLVPAFDKKYGTKTDWVSVGSGEAMEIGKRGDADLLLVHSPAAEKTFINEGNGVNRKDVMYNFFYIVGPKADPAKIKGNKSASDGLKAIAKSKSTFLSRADKSGTHSKELTIWKAADMSPTGASDKWYKEAGLGMGDLLTMANETKAYTLVDSGTWGSMKDKLTNLDVMVQGDPILFNPYGVITVNPTKYTGTNAKAAKAFTEFITSDEGQKIIGNFVNKNGQKLFIPDAK